MFFAIDKVIGLRVKPEIEDAGIDEAYHGIGSYPEFLGIGMGTQAPAKPSGVLPSATD